MTSEITDAALAGVPSRSSGTSARAPLPPEVAVTFTGPCQCEVRMIDVRHLSVTA